MRFPGKFKIVAAVVVVTAGLTVLFQNCAKGKFIDPDVRHSAIAMGFCQECKDASGSGLSCRKDTASSFSACMYESCSPGFKAQGAFCVAVVCEAGQTATCEVAHGEGRMTCNQGGLGYGACTAIQCNEGYTLSSGGCVPVNSEHPPTNPPPEEGGPPKLCVAGSHRDCGTDSTEGQETCADDGMSYGSCVFGSCKAGYNKENSETCVANTCEPSSVTPCEVGAAYGSKTCNSAGSAFGVCVITGCQQGYTLKDSVCVVQKCTPNSEAVCDFCHGTGTKVCNSEGTDYGSCTLEGCMNGYALLSGQCVEQVCSPGSKANCTGQAGSGKKTCNLNGMGYGSCVLDHCDPHFKLKNGQCVDEDYCDAGEKVACTHQNGTGMKDCNPNAHKFDGPCFITACNPGYVLVNQNGNACKKIK